MINIIFLLLVKLILSKWKVIRSVILLPHLIHSVIKFYKRHTENKCFFIFRSISIGVSFRPCWFDYMLSCVSIVYLAGTNVLFIYTGRQMSSSQCLCAQLSPTRWLWFGRISQCIFHVMLITIKISLKRNVVYLKR